MSVFPDTPTMLLTRIAMNVSGEDASVWTEFFELYSPAMHEYLVLRGTNEDVAEEIVQNVFIKLVKILRDRKYEKEKSKFRTYLSRLLYNETVDFYRRSRSREECVAALSIEEQARDYVTPADVLDCKWALARHKAAVRHILEKTALSEQTKRVFLELEKSGDTCENVAKRMNMKAAAVRQIKSRVGRMVNALERRMGI